MSLIVHNGALVHWLLPYEALKPVNVGGTIETLRLACRGRAKRVCYVSTTSVFDDSEHRRATRIAEDDALDTCAGLSGGYPMSKWVADRLVAQARARGLSTAVLRPGYITGDSRRGVWNVDDFLCRLLKGCVQLGAAPALPTAAVLDATPVDVVADVIAAAALADVEHDLNIVNPQRFTFAALFDGLRKFGYEAAAFAYGEWRHRLLESVEQQAGGSSDAAVHAAADGAHGDELNALAPLLSVLGPHWADELVAGSQRVYDNERLLTLCSQASIAFPDMATVLPIYFAYFIRCKFVRAPEREPSNALGIDWRLIGEGIQQVWLRCLLCASQHFKKKKNS